MNAGQQGRKWYNKYYIGNMHKNIPNMEYNQGGDIIKYTNISQ